jgi:DNA-binding LacI/PurR family transcriptional regulator
MASGGSVKIWFPRSVLAFRAPLHLAETLLDRNVDGLILATARLDDELPRLLRKRGVAHVLVLRTDGESPSALGDDEVGGYLAVRHLVDLGHRDIAVVTGPPSRLPVSPGRRAPGKPWTKLA